MFLVKRFFSSAPPHTGTDFAIKAITAFSRTIYSGRFGVSTRMKKKIKATGHVRPSADARFGDGGLPVISSKHRWLPIFLLV